MTADVVEISDLWPHCVTWFRCDTCGHWHFGVMPVLSPDLDPEDEASYTVLAECPACGQVAARMRWDADEPGDAEVIRLDALPSDVVESRTACAGSGSPG